MSAPKSLHKIQHEDPVINRIQDQYIAALTPILRNPAAVLVQKPNWQTVGTPGPAFQNGWTNFDPLRPVQYCLDAFGYVLMRGILQSGTIGSTAFQLPPGFRIGRNARFSVDSNAAFGSCRIVSDGSVQPFVGSNVTFFLDGIRYLVEA